MNNILVKIASIFFLLSFCIAEDANVTTFENQEVILPKQKSIFLSYEEVPKKVYVGELFPVKVKAIIANSEFEDISTTFEHDKNLVLINSDAKWQWFSDNIFYNTFYIKALKESAILPKINVNLIKNDNIIDVETLQSATTNIIKLNGDKYFSSVIAKTLHVNKYKTTQFDEENYIIVLDIEAEYSNLGDFKLDWVKRDGIDSTQENLPFFKIFYYAIIPNYQKHFIFTYFNTENDDFEKITLPVILDDDTVSTQIDLNPKKSGLEFYKNVSYLVLGFIFLYFFIRRRKMIYLVLIFFIIGLFLYEKAPINSVKVATKTKIKILPTENSTIFYTLDRPMYAEKLAKKGDYIKILLPNGKIGWIKETNVSKN
jgi:hypothetical protein